MRKKLRIMLLLSCYGLVLGCGTKGPLYIPEQRYPQQDPAQEAPKGNNPPPLSDKAY